MRRVYVVIQVECLIETDLKEHELDQRLSNNMDRIFDGGVEIGGHTFHAVPDSFKVRDAEVH